MASLVSMQPGSAAVRRESAIWLLAGIALVVLVLAASSGPLELWVTPPSGSDESVAEPEPVDTVAPPPEPDRDDGVKSPLPGGLLNAVAWVVLVVFVGGAVFALRELGSWVPAARFVRRRRPVGPGDAALAEVAERLVSVDVEAARAALTKGQPSDAIVGCWMQLERDAAEVGVPRLAAETSSEYVERVVAVSSVDPRPITELAALYREARFSRHEQTDGHRARAARALSGVVAALDDPPEVLA